ncbi:MAG: Eco57I restriction-modification methylase domain-containing protein [Cyanobacteria bacterium J06636_16]
METIDFEKKRLLLQRQLDSKKTLSERNKLGQFSTPPLLAKSIVRHALSLLGDQGKISFLDPAFGTGSFFSALLNSKGSRSIQKAQGFEIDPYYEEGVSELWQNTNLKLNFVDYTCLLPPEKNAEKFNLIICNPPYIRHHHMSSEEKIRLQSLVSKSCGLHMSGLSGLYCYFLCLAHLWMIEDGIAGWLIPSEFMDVNYGKTIKNYLLKKVTLLQIHRFDAADVQFDDALVSSVVVWIKKSLPPENHKVLFTFGRSLTSPEVSKWIDSSVLIHEQKWTRFPSLDIRGNSEHFCLSDIFEIKRGIATGDNKFFILSEAEIAKHRIPGEFIKPILPSPRYLKTNEVLADEKGIPIIERRLFLLDCHLPEGEIKDKYPELWEYLKTGEGTVSQRYLCRHRKFWYSQEKRDPAPLLCTYLGRRKGNDKRAFRFILNLSDAVAPNVYLLLYPRKKLAEYFSSYPAKIREIWTTLNDLDPSSIVEEGRLYGGGLHKIEPKELGNVDATSVIDSLPKVVRPTKTIQISLFEGIGTS